MYWFLVKLPLAVPGQQVTWQHGFLHPYKQEFCMLKLRINVNLIWETVWLIEPVYAIFFIQIVNVLTDLYFSFLGEIILCDYRP